MPSFCAKGARAAVAAESIRISAKTTPDRINPRPFKIGACARCALTPALALALTGLCFAADAQPLASPLDGIGQMLFGLLSVLAILAACVWLLKRFNNPTRAAGLLRIVGITAVGPRESVVLLEAGEKTIMLGVTPNNVRTLHVFARGELPSVTAPAASPAAAFASRLRQALKGRRDAG
jgi:flagellar protein FliO/FliZ